VAELRILPEERQDALAAYLAGFEGIQSDPEYWKSRFRLWWDDNPAYEPSRVRGWTLEVKGRIVGFLGTVPSRILIGGKPRTARSITTWMVDAAFRNDSLAMLLDLLDDAGDGPVFDTTPTDHVAEVLRALEFQNLPWGGSKEELFASDAAVIAKTALGSLGGTILGSVFGGLQRLRAKLAVPKGLRVDEVLEIADSDYDALWEKTHSFFDATNLRDAASVRWSALADPVVKKRLFECRDSGKLRGYLILKPRYRRGVETFECADLWTDPEHPEAFEALIARAATTPPLVSFPHFTPGIGRHLGKMGMIELTTRPRKNLWLPPKGWNEDSSSYFCLLQGDYATAP